MKDKELDRCILSLFDGMAGNEDDSLEYSTNDTLFRVRALNHLTESVLLLARVIQEKSMYSGV